MTAAAPVHATWSCPPRSPAIVGSAIPMIVLVTDAVNSAPSAPTRTAGRIAVCAGPPRGSATSARRAGQDHLVEPPAHLPVQRVRVGGAGVDVVGSAWCHSPENRPGAGRPSTAGRSSRTASRVPSCIGR
jgi:hypothetical protein